MIKIDTKELLKALKLLKIGNLVQLCTSENLLHIGSTNLEQGVIINLPCVVTKHISREVDYATFLKIVKVLKTPTITILEEDRYININGFKIHMWNVNPFPQINNKAKLSVDSLNLIKAFKKVSPAIDSKNPKFELNGALLSIDDNGCDIVATDTKRLARVHIDQPTQPNTQELKLIIPKKAIIEIQKLFNDNIDMYYDEDVLIIQNQNCVFYTRIIQGRYPQYKRIIPRNSRYNLQLPKKEMIESIKMITPLCKNITMVISPNSIIFKPLSDDVGEVKTELFINLELEHNCIINVNSQYLLDFIMLVDSENFEFLFSEDNLPFLLQDGAFQTVVMPIIS